MNIACQMGQEFGQLLLPHLRGMPFIVKENEAPNPIYIACSVRMLKCFRRITSRTWSNNFFGLFREAEFCKVGNMSGIFPSCSEEDKRIRPEKPVIKGGIFLPTSR
jgi:hypothetical protein